MTIKEKQEQLSAKLRKSREFRAKYGLLLHGGKMGQVYAPGPQQLKYRALVKELQKLWILPPPTSQQKQEAEDMVFGRNIPDFMERSRKKGWWQPIQDELFIIQFRDQLRKRVHDLINPLPKATDEQKQKAENTVISYTPPYLRQTGVAYDLACHDELLLLQFKELESKLIDDIKSPQ